MRSCAAQCRSAFWHRQCPGAAEFLHGMLHAPRFRARHEVNARIRMPCAPQRRPTGRYGDACRRRERFAAGACGAAGAGALARSPTSACALPRPAPRGNWQMPIARRPRRARRRLRQACQKDRRQDAAQCGRGRSAAAGCYGARQVPYAQGAPKHVQCRHVSDSGCDKVR